MFEKVVKNKANTMFLMRKYLLQVSNIDTNSNYRNIFFVFFYLPKFLTRFFTLWYGFLAYRKAEIIILIASDRNFQLELCCDLVDIFQ